MTSAELAKKLEPLELVRVPKGMCSTDFVLQQLPTDRDVYAIMNVSAI